MSFIFLPQLNMQFFDSTELLNLFTKEDKYLFNNKILPSFDSGIQVP